MDGRGHGALAAALRKSPTDLTELTKSNRGRFPDTHIVVVLQNGVEPSGSRSGRDARMGADPGKDGPGHTQDRLLRISNLSRYLESIQAR